jgi:hypothetical protein
MRTPSFREIASLLNLNSHIDINVDPDQKGEGWSMHWCRHTVQGFSNKFRVVYLKSDATRKDIEKASEEVARDQTFVIYPPSLDNDMDFHRNKLKEDAEKFQNSKEYLKSPMKDEIEEYKNELESQRRDKYIEPRFDTHVLKRPNPVRSFLKKQLYPVDKGKLGIILAGPGQGKTYMSRHIVGEMARRSINIVPILVDSSQWNKMSPDDQRSIWKTMTHSFNYFDTPISWIKGSENKFLQSTLKADIFRVVFDGFDEYILRNKGVVKAEDTLANIIELVRSTGTRIVITSRTSFWENTISEEKRNELEEREEIEVFKIRPFDEAKAREYFKRNNRSDDSQEKAINIYRDIRGDNEEFVGKGFVISLISDAAEGADSSKSKGLTGARNNRFDALMWLMETLCRREERRQELALDEQDQLSLLQAIAYERAKNHAVDDDTFDLLVFEEKSTISEKEVDRTRSKFVSHPILRRIKGQDSEYWEFEQVQVELALLSKQILEMEGRKLARRAHNLEVDPKNVPDLSSFLVEFARSKSSGTRDAVSHLSQLISNVSNSRVYGLQAQLALSSVDEFEPQGTLRSDRTEMLLRLTGKNDIRDISFSGSTIRSFDFTEVIFRGCEFHEITFANCKFNEETTFRGCRFGGGVPPKNCNGFGLSEFEGCVFDKTSKTWLKNERHIEGKDRYDKDQLRREFQMVIDKFTVKGSDVVKPSSKKDVYDNYLSRSPKKDAIIDALEGKVISFDKDKAKVLDEAKEDVYFFEMNNNFKGRLRESFEEAIDKCDL